MKKVNWLDHKEDIEWFVNTNHPTDLEIVVLQKDRLVIFDKRRKSNISPESILELLNHSWSSGWDACYRTVRNG